MFDTSTYPQSALYGLPQLGQQQGPFAQPQLPGFVPIVSLVPQSLIVSLVVQSLQQAQIAAGTQQGALGHPTGQFASQFGAPQLSLPFGQPQFLQSPWQQSPFQTIGGWGGQSPYAGAFGRGVLGFQAAPQMAYAGQPFAG